MRVGLAAAIVLVASVAEAAPIQKGMTVADFFKAFQMEATDLAEGGMDLNRARCTDDGTMCGGYYGSANTVVAQGPKGGDLESVTVTQVEPGESQDFWLTTGIVMDILDGDFKTIPERSTMILESMRSPPGTSFEGNIGHYTFGRSDMGLSQVIVTAK
jgi:hypothetical protein